MACLHGFNAFEANRLGTWLQAQLPFYFSGLHNEPLTNISRFMMTKSSKKYNLETSKPSILTTSTEIYKVDGVYKLTISYKRETLWNLIFADTIAAWVENNYPDISLQAIIQQVIQSNAWQDEDIESMIESAEVTFLRGHVGESVAESSAKSQEYHTCSSVDSPKDTSQDDYLFAVQFAKSWSVNDWLVGYKERPLFAN